MPYTFSDSTAYVVEQRNAARTAKVWINDYKDIFYKVRPLCVYREKFCPTICIQEIIGTPEFVISFTFFYFTSFPKQNSMVSSDPLCRYTDFLKSMPIMTTPPVSSFCSMKLLGEDDLWSKNKILSDAGI
uniref:Uncharacterized protein n=1 Tax=Romanomermis culicivorax TaxID=13658 RepID=A0A915IRK8_ROMCU